MLWVGMLKVILDMDPGIDDALALILALNSPEIEVIGITTTFGNVPLDKATKNVFRILGLLDRLDIPVYKGAYRPIMGHVDYALDIHGDDGLGDVEIPYVNAEPVGDAVKFLIGTVKEYDDVTIVATGPLTNIALSILLDREFPHRVYRVINMGGAFHLTEYGYGNVNAVAEFNIYSDPHAAAIVYGSGLNLYSVGLDVTRDPSAVFNMDEVTRIGRGGGKIGRLFPKMTRNILSVEGAVAIHDAVPIAYLIEPSILRFTDVCVEIETCGLDTYGETVVDRREWLPMEMRQGTVIKAAYWIDGERFKHLLLERVFKY